MRHLAAKSLNYHENFPNFSHYHGKLFPFSSTRERLPGMCKKSLKPCSRISFSQCFALKHEENFEIKLLWWCNLSISVRNFVIKWPPAVATSDFSAQFVFAKCNCDIKRNKSFRINGKIEKVLKGAKKHQLKKYHFCGSLGNKAVKKWKKRKKVKNGF